jgi:hypothetical protein
MFGLAARPNWFGSKPDKFGLAEKKTYFIWLHNKNFGLTLGLGCLVKGTVQRKLRWVKGGNNQ